MADHSHGFRPTVSAEHARRLRAWHEAAYAGQRNRSPAVCYMGLHLTVAPTVFAPTPMSDLFGTAVLEETRETDRVLDMGTGSGSNAILAATTGASVVAVDINPAAVDCARRNAVANGVASRVTVAHSDLFGNVDGRFDLILFDPPFRWFPPRDLLDAAMTDEGYRTLTRFMAQAPDRLHAGGRLLLTFGTTGDIGYLRSLMDASSLTCEVAHEQQLVKDGWGVTYYVYRLCRRSG